MPIIHSLRVLHRELYATGKKLSKSDKLGLHACIEEACLRMLSLSIEAAFQPKQDKVSTLNRLRLKTEVLKNLWRTEQELEIVDEKTYLRIAQATVEISKMTNGWIKSVTQKEP